MARVCQPHAIVNCNLSFTFWSHNLSPVSRKISLFFHWKAQLFNLLSPKNCCQPHFLVSNKIQSIRQHHFWNKLGVNFWLYSFICCPAQLEGQWQILKHFYFLPIYKHFYLFLGSNFYISPCLMTGFTGMLLQV